MSKEGTNFEKGGAKKVPVMRHFDDIDDLLKHGRDAVLIPNQEGLAASFAEKIYASIKESGQTSVMFICSERIRSIQTADLIINEIKKFDPNLKCRVSSEKALSNIDQGKFILSDDYEPGKPFAGLELANKIFAQEVFSGNNNYLYHFGDPILQSDGSFKYPKLSKYFKSYGENYREFLLRIYNMILNTSKKVAKLERKTKVVVITHAQLYQILKDISEVATMIKKDGLEIHPGDLPKICWELYQKRFKSETPSYNLNYVSIEGLYDTDILGFLEKEIQYLENIK